MRYRIDPTSPSGISPADDINQVSISSTTSGGSGTDDHSALTNLDYASSGHTGFEPAKGADDNYITDAEKAVWAPEDSSPEAADYYRSLCQHVCGG